MSWTSLCELGELIEGQGKLVQIDGFGLAVFLHQGQVHVMDNICPHAGHDLSSGAIENDCAVCPWHGWFFRLSDGQMPGSPGIAVRVYQTRLLTRDDQPTLVQADLPMY